MKFTINKKTYDSLPFDFEMMCQIEERGIETEELGNKKKFVTAKAYFAICSGLPDIVASNEINAHVIAGGNLAELMNAMNKEMDDSAFIKALLKQTQQNETETTQEATPQEVPQIQETSETKSESTEA